MYVENTKNPFKNQFIFTIHTNLYLFLQLYRFYPIKNLSRMSKTLKSAILLATRCIKRSKDILTFNSRCLTKWSDVKPVKCSLTQTWLPWLYILLERNVLSIILSLTNLWIINIGENYSKNVWKHYVLIFQSAIVQLIYLNTIKISLTNSLIVIPSLNFTKKRKINVTLKRFLSSFGTCL